MLDITEIKYRKAPQKYQKMQVEGEKSNTINRKKTKLYDYYICDYCKTEIRLDKKQEERSGGITILPHSLTKCGEITAVLCGKCVKEAIKQLEKNN